MAKMDVEKESGGKWIGKDRRMSGSELDGGCVASCDRKSATTYTHLRCNKGTLQSWRNSIRKNTTYAGSVKKRKR